MSQVSGNPYVVGGKIGWVVEEFPTKRTLGKQDVKTKKGRAGVQYSHEF